ncbi:CD276 antigen homolog [Clarias gariepinus]|uniref:CD276 antigen homolog n=1 Tax=Clarias gariepinus TaxID=13013 RepID=UPI00234DE1F7|nr:CD276 antigen homolog [Clarias gariepinus]
MKLFFMLYAMSVSYSWIFCFTFLLLIHKVSVQSGHVEGVIGQTVTLPCSITPMSLDVFWRDSAGRTVCDIIAGKADYDEQDPVYKDRIKFENGNGNSSIMLSNVMKSDAGTYTCTSPNVKTQSVELTVTERPVTTERPKTQTTTQKEQSQNKKGRSGNGDMAKQADDSLPIHLCFN